MAPATKCCAAQVRVGDLLARWGGEEFLLVMPGTDAGAALHVAARLAAAVRATRFDDLAPGLVVTFSAGVADCGDADDLEAAIARADGALYAAKHAGRDRVMVAPAPAPQASRKIHAVPAAQANAARAPETAAADSA
jgi:diguanylate cyclase